MTVGKSSQDGLVDMEKMVISINRAIELYWSSHDTSDGMKPCSIHKVPEHILEVNRTAYEPIVLSIGPYHHGAHNLVDMEREKWKCLDFILKFNCEVSLQDYIRAIYKLEKRARSCYSQQIKMEKRKFVQVLLLDACFILVKVDGTIAAPMHLEEVHTDVSTRSVNDKYGVECLNSGQAVESNCSAQRNGTQNLGHEIELTICHDDQAETSRSTRNSEKNADNPYGYSSSGDWYSNSVWHDLFLLENQMPFFIIETIYNLAFSKHRVKELLRDKIVECVEDIMRQFPKGIKESIRPKEFHHLLHLCHMYLRPTHKFVGTTQHQLKDRFFPRLVHLGWRYFSIGPNKEQTEEQQLLTHPSDCFQAQHLPNRWRQAVQYHETGVQLKKRVYSSSDRHSLLDINFSYGILEIPYIAIDENTESLFKNLIAFEQMDPQYGNCIAAYITFMSQFVSTSEDATLLTEKEIIVHMLDSDEEVSAMFTRLSTHVYFGSDSNHYLKTLCHILEEHYQNSLNRWMALLWRNHLSNPWLALGVFAAVIVLLCTIVQTIYTVLAYTHPH